MTHRILHILSRLLPIIGLVLFVWIVRKTGTDTIIDAFRNIDYRWLLPIPLFVAVFTFAKAKKWQWILRAYGIEYPLQKCASSLLIAFFASLLTPAKIGDAIRTTYLKRDTGTPISTGLSTIFIDRIFDLLTLIVLIGISIFIFWYYFTFSALFPAVMGGVIGIIVAAGISTNEHLVRKILRPFFYFFMPKRFHEKSRSLFNAFYGKMTAAKQNKHLLAKAFFINLVAWCVTLSYFFVIARAVGVPLTITHTFAVEPIALFVEILPLSISGIGTRDATLFFLFQQLSLPMHLAVPFSIAYLVLSSWLIGFIGLILWFRDPISFRNR